MKASHRWLCELVGQTFSPEEVAQRFTDAGLEVESTHRWGAASEHVKLARVVKVEAHPTRAKLSLVTVDAGAGEESVVCGAPNVPPPGHLVVLAPLGTYLPAKNLTLEPKEIAGVKSEGMLCSESELGLRIAGGEGGILVLPPGSGTPGQTLASAIPESSDYVFEIGLTPNRPDGLGHLGLARELAALAGIAFQHEPPTPKEIDPAAKTEAAVEIRIEDEERCPSYGGALVERVRVQPSPLGLQYRLEALGIRAISNVVDVTNWVMLKYGHPIHAFDLERVRGKKILVRRATDAEKMQTLDGVERQLSTDDLVIADGEGAVALAGVMGAEGSGIQDSTQRVLIECAYFTPRGVRRSSRRHGLHTESSHRFERGVDPGDVSAVLQEAAAKLCEIAGGVAAGSVQIVGSGVSAPKAVQLRFATMNALLGVTIPRDEAVKILERLGCKIGSLSEESVQVTPPTHRPDLGIEADFIEEVIRVRGVDAIPAVIPGIRPGTPRTHEIVPRAVVRAAIEVGLSQALTFAFTSPEALAAIGAPAPGFALANPLSDDRTVMRTSLLPGLFDALRRSRRHGVPNVRLFTMGARYLADATKPLADEVKSFAAVIAGHRDAVLQKPTPIDVYDAKGVALEIVERTLHRRAEVRTADPLPAHLHPRAAGRIDVEGVLVGTFGMIHPKIERSLELDGPCAVIEIDLEALERCGVRTARYRPIPILPATTRDMQFAVPHDVTAGEVQRTILESAGELAESVELFDLFSHESLGPDRRALAFHVVYRDPLASSDPDKARTLTDAEVEARHKAVIAAVRERHGAELRG